VALVNELFTATMAAAAAEAAAPAASKLEPPVGVTRLADAPPEQAAAWRAAGLAAIAAGRMGVIILAGGQGTRLGFDKPKGLYDVRLPSHRCLFALQAQRLIRLKELAAAAAGVPPSSVALPLYVMTSPQTDADTRAAWEASAYFGLPRGDVTFFSQGTLPCLTFDGKIMLESGGAVATAPDGNGGIYRGLHTAGVVADMARRGVTGVHVFAVDNAVVRAGDPVFLGYCDSRGADVGNKVCPKAGPHEKVGVLARRGGAYTVVEYSEMDKASAEAVDPATGALLYNAGNICIHYYSRAFLEGPASPSRLPKVYHVARKAIPYAHPDTGATLSKAELAARHGAATGGNSGIKLESFIFDVFPASTAMAAFEVGREAEFSPVKNAPGAADDSPDTARALVARLHAGWLAAAGAAVEPAPGTAPASAASPPLVEVSPLASYGGEGLGALAGQTVVAPALVLAAGERAVPPGAGWREVDGEGGPLPGGCGVTVTLLAGVDLPGYPADTPLRVYRLPPVPAAGAAAAAADGSGGDRAAKRSRAE
jgi:UDP-N-acetylglucosamine/UDP-N-acetylgalactosamine diphosphorylase